VSRPQGRSDSECRVRAALSFETPDRVPRYDTFWPEFTEAWRRQKGLSADVTPQDYYGIDLHVAVADETPWPTRVGLLSQDGEDVVSRDGWGRVTRTAAGAYFSETLEVALPDKARLDSLEFDSPLLPSRYKAFLAAVAEHRPRRAVFAKTGGPFLRSSYIRGEVQFLMDLAEDEAFARALAERVADHIGAVGVESLRLARDDLCGIWIYDDVASNEGPMMSPRTYERVFLPVMSRMVAAYKEAGADYVIFHSDGNILALLDMLIEAGVDAIQPVEPKAGMDLPAIRERYGDRLALIGGLDNAFVLPSGDRERIAADLKRVLSAGKEGGLIVGSHSIGDDISVEAYDYLHELEEQWCRYPLRL